MEWSGPSFQRNAKHLAGLSTPVVAELGRSERRVAAARYVQGLLLPGQRKCIEPIAATLGVDAQGLQQFVSDSPWSDHAVWRVVVRQDIIPHLEPGPQCPTAIVVSCGHSRHGERCNLAAAITCWIAGISISCDCTDCTRPVLLRHPA